MSNADRAEWTACRQRAWGELPAIYGGAHPNRTDEAAIRRAADAILVATSTTLNPSPDIAGCPDDVARIAIPAVLRAYADTEHHFGEGFAQRVEYGTGTGTEHDAICACGASWAEDGCTERERLLAVAAEVERGDSPPRGLILNGPAAGTTTRSHALDQWSATLCHRSGLGPWLHHTHVGDGNYRHVGLCADQPDHVDVDTRCPGVGGQRAVDNLVDDGERINP